MKLTLETIPPTSLAWLAIAVACTVGAVITWGAA